MRTSSFPAGLLVLLLAPAAFALDLGGLNKVLGNTDKLSQALDTARDATKALKGVAGIGPAEERVIGDSVALEIVGRYGGLVRDDVTLQRVNLVGRALARYSDRPELNWRFGVLDSDTVNAFSAPDGYVFITRGLYALAANDDDLAAILGHEIAHITGKHALKIVQRGEFLAGVGSQVVKRSGNARELDAQLKQFDLGVTEITKTLFEKGFDPATEYSADKAGRQLAVTTGYAPGALRAVLTQLQAAPAGGQKTFSTHPPLSERIRRLPADPAPAPTGG
jgi:beta-barrel assembly-enhancing protease